MLKKIDKLFSLDYLYLFLGVFLIFYVIEGKNILDLMYFAFLTFYYIKIKLYRWKKYR